MNLYATTGVVLAIVFYVLLIVQLLLGGTKQNLATWFLWALIDIIAAGTVYNQDGNYQLMAVYAVGSTLVAISIITSGERKWTWFESLITALVLACIVLWITQSARSAAILSTVAMVIAGLPQIKDAFKHPWDTPVLCYIGFCFANAFTIVAGEEWSVKERLYPTAALAVTTLIVIGSVRRVWVVKMPKAPLATI